jgi:hypothetical protein
MQTLALNAYQLKKLANYSLQENDLTLEWVNEMDIDTIKLEEDLSQIEQELKLEQIIKYY